MKKHILLSVIMCLLLSLLCLSAVSCSLIETPETPDDGDTTTDSNHNGGENNPISTDCQTHSFDAKNVCEYCGTTYKGIGLSFTLDSQKGECTVSKFSGGGDTVYIPEKYKGYPVTTIGYEAFAHNKTVKSVYIPKTVKSVGQSAFKQCSNLTSVSFSEGLVSLEYSAFSDCERLAKITLPNTLTNVGQYTFSGCSRLEAINIPDGVKVVGQYAFRYCKALTDIVIPDSVGEIGVSAFSDCTALKTVTIGSEQSSVTKQALTIWENAFYQCTALTDVKLGNHVVGIGPFAFSACTALENINLPDSITSIGNSAFYNCGYYNNKANWTEKVLYMGNYLIKADPQLTGNYTVKSGTKIIVPRAFYQCNAITNLTLPDSVYIIDDYSFSDCTALETVALGNGLKQIGTAAFSGCTKLQALVLADGTERVGDEAFSGCSLLSTITIPDVQISLGRDAFLNTAYYNQAANWTNGVLYISNHLIAVDPVDVSACIIRSGTKTIAATAFESSQVVSVTLPDSLVLIGNSAFRNCNKLMEVINYSNLALTVGDDQFGYVAYYAKEIHTGSSKIVNQNDCLFYPLNGVNYFLSYVGQDPYLTLPESYNGGSYQIYDYAFKGNSFIKNVTISAGVTAIGNYAFDNCSALAEVMIGDGVKTIGSYAFSNCMSLTKVTIGTEVTRIGYSAFYNMALVNVTFRTTAGWWVSTSATATSGRSMAVTSTYNAALNLRSIYSTYYWNRTVS